MSTLKGKIIISTASEEKSKKIKDVFSKKGAIVYNFPLINIKEANNYYEEIKKTFQNINSYQTIIFTSSNAVKYFFYWLEKLKINFSAKKTKFAVIGKATEKKLNKQGYKAKYNFQSKNSIEFAKELLKSIKQKKQKILIPSGNLSPNNLLNILSEQHKCKKITIYNTHITKQIDDNLLSLIYNKKYNYIIFLSPSAVSGLIDNIPKDIEIKNLNCISIGNITEKKINEYGLNSLFLPSIPDIEILANELEQILNTSKNNIKTKTL